MFYHNERMKRTILLLLMSVLFSGLSYAQTGYFIPSDRFSSSLISDLCQDKQGSIWIATDYGLNRFDGYRFQTFLHNESDSNSLAVNVVVSLLTDRDGQLWVGTNHGLNRFDSDTETFINYPFPYGLHPRVSDICQRKNGTLLVGTDGYGLFSLKDGKLSPFVIDQREMYFTHIFEDSKGRLWKAGFDETIVMFDGKKVTRFTSMVGNPQGFIERDGEVLVLCLHGLMSYRNGKMTVANIDISQAVSREAVFTTISLGESNNIYIGTRGQGLYRLISDGTRRLVRVDIDAYGIDLNTARVNCVFFDRGGNMWLGCHRKGLLMMPLRPMAFKNWSFQSQGVNLGSTISSVCEGDDGMIWCTVQGVGVYGFDRNGHVKAHPASPDAVEFIFRDNLKRYWVGTDDGLFAYDPNTGRYQLKVTFDCDKFNDMTSGPDGRIFISTYSRGFCVYDPKTEELRNYNFNQGDSVNGRICNNWIQGMATDTQGLLWMATTSGVSCFNPATGSFRSQGWGALLYGVGCFDVCELHSGQLSDGRQLRGCIAIGTEQGLYLYDRRTRNVERFPGSEQLNNKAISYIVQSNEGDLWCSTSQGIWQYQLRTHTFIGFVGGNGLTQKEYLYGVGMHTDNDKIFFAHSDGLTTFMPKDIKADSSSLAPLHLTGVLVGGQVVTSQTVLNDIRVTDKPVWDSDLFTLSYLDHTITLGFSQMTFDNPMNVIFEYRVDDGDWIRNPVGVNEFTLSHLQPGTYHIHVRALQGSEYTPEKEVTLVIRAPWYRTKLAYFIYFAILVSLGVYVFVTYRRRATEQMNEEKMKFLINATHDIRSPLTLIMSPLANLKRRLSGTDQTDALRDIDTIEHNAKRILNLVNQILDVRKIDKQQLQLHCQQTDMVKFVNGICRMYEYNASERHITFRFNHEDERLEAWIDRSQFDKVVTNLLSNAFKYSFDGGTIEINLSHDDKNLKLQVVDTGVGLDGDSLKHIFDRFYQGTNSYRLHIDGTGIGLNLCKMIVDMHHGTIEARNRQGEKGSVFEVCLPLGKEHLTEQEIVVEASDSQYASSAATHQTANKHRVLVVDDDEEICRYISTELGRYYKFTTSPNGRDGLKELLTGEYDVVVSDVMMPEMDGFTMLRMIKTNVNIAHIPVVMLTSKADVANRLEGLERGADAFLAKPFDLEELHMVIENLIQGRQRLKGKYSGAQQQVDKLEQPEVKGNDELLMERIMKAVNKNLSNSDFNVDMLTQEVGISRAQLHRKMKEMTGISTSEFIRNIRLEQAARLLREQKINVTQVAYTVGFSNLAHFSTIFRKHFGIAPSEYAERNGEVDA
jgi:signal transduction histidine kinase/ligand-binding sensor domain-containing protein/DNA-binding response OmpR family regulator